MLGRRTEQARHRQVVFAHRGGFEHVAFVAAPGDELPAPVRDLERVDVDVDVRDVREAVTTGGGPAPDGRTAAGERTAADTDAALIVYTSGTTGPPKGAMNTHRNVVFNARTYRDWVGLGPDDVILGVAPLFHITGLIGHIAAGLLTGAPLVLMYRLHPSVTIETIQAEQATFTVGAITVFIALMNAPNASKEALTSLTKIYSGGAPIPPSTVRAFQEAQGFPVDGIVGLQTWTALDVSQFGSDDDGDGVIEPGELDLAQQ